MIVKEENKRLSLLLALILVSQLTLDPPAGSTLKSMESYWDCYVLAIWGNGMRGNMGPHAQACMVHVFLGTDPHWGRDSDIVPECKRERLSPMIFGAAPKWWIAVVLNNTALNPLIDGSKIDSLPLLSFYDCGLLISAKSILDEEVPPWIGSAVEAGCKDSDKNIENMISCKK